IRRPFLENRFRNGSGRLYEGTLADFYPKAVDKLEAKTNKSENNRATIRRLADLLAQPGPLPLGEVSQLVELDAFLRFWAIESLISFWDGYTANQNNYFVYENPDTGKLHFLPWGADGAFTSGGGPFGSLFNQGSTARSEEHTSELQSRENLVCR